MNININRKARQFAKHNMHYTVDINTVMSYLKNAGYTVVFYTPNEPNDIITGYGLTAQSERSNAFTFRQMTERFVFLRSDLTEEKKLYVLLHEVGHVALGHMDDDHIPKHEHLEEMEAEAFAYAVLQSKPTNYIICALITLCTALCFCIGLGVYSNHTNNLDNTSDSNTIPRAVYETVIPEPTKSESVYITPTGKKFHRPSCRYVQNKNCASMLRSEALKSFEPCKVCNP